MFLEQRHVFKCRLANATILWWVAEDLGRILLANNTHTAHVGTYHGLAETILQNLFRYVRDASKLDIQGAWYMAVRVTCSNVALQACLWLHAAVLM